MYRLSTVAICILLLLLMLAGVEFGQWVGRRRRAKADESARSHLDRPRRGLIKTDQTGLVELRALVGGS